MRGWLNLCFIVVSVIRTCRRNSFITRVDDLPVVLRDPHRITGHGDLVVLVVHDDRRGRRARGRGAGSSTRRLPTRCPAGSAQCIPRGERSRSQTLGLAMQSIISRSRRQRVGSCLGGGDRLGRL